MKGSATGWNGSERGRERKDLEIATAIIISDLPQTVLDTFHEKVAAGDPGECWPWLAGLNENGYGRFSVRSGRGKRRYFYAHRVSYVIEHGSIDGTVMVLHSCGNSVCCNPHHLYPGDDQDNANDRDEHGRTARGAKLPQSKLNPEAVRLARKLYASGATTYAVLAQRFGVTKAAIRFAVTGVTWKYVDAESEVA